MTPFQNTPCSVRVSNNYDTSGTITRADVAELTPTQLESLFKPGGLYADMDSWFRTSFEMKACGTKVNGLYDWVNSSTRQMGHLLNVEKVDRNPGMLKPFVLGRQDSVINTEFWAITCGAPVSGYTTHASTVACSAPSTMTGPLTSGQLALGSASDRVIRVVNRYGVDLDSKWFLDKDRVHIFSTYLGVAATGQWKVMASAVSADLSFIDVLVKSENAGSSTPFNPAPAAGVLVPGGNNVSDFEPWCQNRPTLDPRKRVPFWYQTMRRVRRVDSEYQAVFKKLMETNKFFQEFGDLPMAERNRQDEELFQKRWLNSFFFGKAISANQTMANWQSLEQILTVDGTNIDVGLGGKLVAYRANMVGVYEQLRACDRVRDLQNQRLNLYEFFKEIYNICRSRKSQGRKADSIDIYTDSQYAADFETGMINYYKAEYGDILRINIETGSNELGFNWRTFEAKFPVGVKINIITHEYFDDIQNAFETESMGSRGRFLLILDMGKAGPKGGTIYPGMIKTNRKMRTLGELENLGRIDPTFACTMEYITEQISLTSETVTAVCECPANSLWIEGIASGPPSIVGYTANPTYANLY